MLKNRRGRFNSSLLSRVGVVALLALLAAIVKIVVMTAGR
jgi:hypothetical protein